MTLSATSAVNLALSVSDDDTMTVGQGIVSVQTTSPGYRLYISMTGDTTGLSGIADGISGNIPATSGSLTSPISLTRGTWGYAIPSSGVAHLVTPNGFSSTYEEMSSTTPDTSKLFAVPPTSSSNPQMIASSTSSTSGDNYPIYYAVRANSATAPGEYSNKVLFTAVADASTTDDLVITPSSTPVNTTTTVTVKTPLYTTASYADADIYLLTESQYNSESSTPTELSCAKTSGTPLTYSCTVPAQENIGTYYILASVPTYDITYSGTFEVINMVTLTVDPNGGTWEGYTTSQTYTQNEGTTKNITNPTGESFTITYDANSQGASYNPTPASVSKPFIDWTIAGGGSLSGTTYTFGATSGSLTATYEASATMELPAISKTNYACHWAEGSASGTTYNGGDEVSITADTTFYAVCNILPSVTINPNGETWSGSTEAQTFYQPSGTVKTVADPTTATYSITYDGNNQGASYTATVNSITPTFSSWALTGGGTWNANTSTYTFASTNGTLTASYANNTLTLPAITKTNYNCAWAEGSASGTQHDGGDVLTVTDNLALYAVCTIKPSLTVNPNGGTWESSTSSQTFYENAGITKTINNPTATPSYTIGYDMGSTGITAPTSPTSASRPFSSWTLTGGGSISGTTYTFGATDGTLTATYGDATFTLPALSKTGYNCKWAEGSASGTQYDGNTSRSISGNTTYYAVCTINQYTLTINANGGSYSPATVTQNYNTTYTLSNPTGGPTYTISYNMNSTGITAPTSPTSATRTFSSWSKSSGTGTLSGSTWTFGAGNGAVIANYGNGSFTLPALSKTNYTCKWAEGSASGTQYAGGTSRTISADTTYYAVCTYQPLLTINPNGGKWNNTTSNSTFRQAPNSTKTGISNPDTNASYTISYNANSQGATYTGSPTSATRNFSSWSLSGGGSFSNGTYTYGTTDGTLTASYNTTSNSFTLPKITKAGHTCKWAEGSASGTQYAGETSKTITANTTYYAVCSANNYTVSITNSNTTSGASSIDVPYGGSKTVTVTPASGYYLSGVSCPSGYICTGYTTGTSATGQQTVTVTNNNTQSGGTLGFTGTVAYKYMQDQTNIDACKNAATGTSFTLKDSRDNNDYVVKKLADGNCWMTQNLRLQNKSISNADSNLPSGKTVVIPASSTANWCTTNSSACDDQLMTLDATDTSISGQSSAQADYGVYYNWYTATATYGTYSTSGSVSYDICPKGWRLPTSGSSGEFKTLYGQYNTSALMQDATNGPGFVLSGYRRGSSTNDQGSSGYGYYWSSTARNSSYAYFMRLSSSGVNTAAYSNGKYSGLTVRCIAQ